MNVAAINVRLNSCIFAYTRPMGILANFLTDDIGLIPIDSMIKWIQNDIYTFTTLNYSYIRKHKNFIRIYFLYDGYELKESADREKFEATKEELIDILQQWQKALKVKLKNYIILKKENDIFQIKIKY